MAKKGQKLFFVLDPKNSIVFESGDMSEALGLLHTRAGGSRLVRGDGVVLAFMTSDSHMRGKVTLSKKVKQQVLVAARASAVSG